MSHAYTSPASRSSCGRGAFVHVLRAGSAEWIPAPAPAFTPPDGCRGRSARDWV